MDLTLPLAEALLTGARDSAEELPAHETHALQRALQELPPRAKMALMLARDGNGYAVAAQQLGIPASEVGDLTERALAYLVEAVSRETQP